MNTVMRHKLEELEESGTSIKVGVIGAGFFGCSTIGQVSRVPGITTSIIADLYEEKAVRGFVRFGRRKPKEIVEVNEADTANHYIEKNIPVITKNSQVLIESDVDVIFESTGVPEAASKHAYEAINKKRNVVMATVEAECVVGPLLAKMAQENGVVYSQAYGDQPALICELYDWAISLGFKVVAAGEGTAARLEWRHNTPDDALQRFGFTQDEIDRLKLNPKMYNSFIDTTKSAVEMVAVCNATGLKPDVRGMHFPLGSIKDVPKLLSLKKDGGILENEGVVDVITRVRPDGRRIRNDIRWGVFVVVTSDSRDVRGLFKTYEAPRGARGRNALVYRPHHWAGLEASISLIRAVLYSEPTGAPLPTAPSAEVLAAAKKTLKSGDILDGGGGYTAYGLAERADIAREENLLPLGLAEGIRVVKEVPPDGVISYDDVELNEDSFLLKLRRMQDKAFY
ncbi:MAG: NAD(P)H-dependent oxidoreductase [Candidatus Bathyarchaeia archaeon]